MTTDHNMKTHEIPCMSHDAEKAFERSPLADKHRVELGKAYLALRQQRNDLREALEIMVRCFACFEKGSSDPEDAKAFEIARKALSQS